MLNVEFERLELEAHQTFGVLHQQWMPKIEALLLFVRTGYIGWPHPPMVPWYAEGVRATVCTFSYYFRIRFRSDGAMEAKNLKFNNRVEFFETGNTVSPEAFLQALKLCEKLARADVVKIDAEMDGLDANAIAALKSKLMTKTTKAMLTIRQKYHPVNVGNMTQYFTEMVSVINSRI